MRQEMPKAVIGLRSNMEVEYQYGRHLFF